MSKWYYFGCGTGPGHYLFGEGMRSIGSVKADDRILTKMKRGTFDNLLPPLLTPIRLYEATYNVLEGMGFVAVAWHDQSEDKRAGSNSVIFAPIDGPDGIWPTYEHVLEGALQKFPLVLGRLPVPLRRWVRA